MAATQALTVDSFGVHFKGTYSETNDFTMFPANIIDSWLLPLSSGTGAGAANFFYRKQYTILLSATETINLRSLVDEFSNTVIMTKLKGLFIRLYSSLDLAAAVKIGGTASGNTFSAIFADPSDIITLPYGGIFFFGSNGAGLTVDATHRNIDIVNQSGTQSVVVDFRALGEK